MDGNRKHDDKQQALTAAVSGFSQRPSWRELGEGWKRVSDALKRWGFLAVVPLGFAAAGFFALMVMADGLATSPWDHASPQDLVWLGMRMPVLGSLLAFILWLGLAFVGWTRSRMVAVYEAVEPFLEQHGGTFTGRLRAWLLRLWLFGTAFVPYVGVAVGLVHVFGDSLVHAAEAEMKSTLRPRAVSIRTVGSAGLEAAELRGRLGDYYVFTDEQGPRLVARSQVIELRGPLGPLR